METHEFKQKIGRNEFTLNLKKSGNQFTCQIYWIVSNPMGPCPDDEDPQTDIDMERHDFRASTIDKAKKAANDWIQQREFTPGEWQAALEANVSPPRA